LACGAAGVTGAGDLTAEAAGIAAAFSLNAGPRMQHSIMVTGLLLAAEAEIVFRR
jgi:hypothetical protein